MAKNKSIGPLLAAALADKVDEVRNALTKAANVEERDRDGRGSLHHAVINGSSEIVEVLLAADADANAADEQGWTPLHFAARDHRVDIAELLIEHGARVDSVDAFGNTPLFRAVFESRGRGEMIQALVRAGADRDHLNLRGVSPLKLASTIANYDVKRWF